MKKINVLITAASRRVPLVRAFRTAVEKFGKGRVVTTDINPLSPALYFGTTTGQLWIGRDGGERWECLFDALPPIHCVKVAVI